MEHFESKTDSAPSFLPCNSRVYNQSYYDSARVWRYPQHIQYYRGFTHTQNNWESHKARKSSDELSCLDVRQRLGRILPRLPYITPPSLYLRGGVTWQECIHVRSVGQFRAQSPPNYISQPAPGIEVTTFAQKLSTTLQQYAVQPFQ
jgi:hypothetical protein